VTAICTLLAVGLTMFAGSVLLRRLGFPTGPAKALGWGVAVLAGALALGTLIARNGGEHHGPSGGPGVGDILLILVLVALATVGEKWVKARFGERKHDRKPLQVRRRALPPAPNLPQNLDGDPPAA
jgi:hypothetical protein